ncbi:MAG: hypothetical protein NWR72_10415 [Bacteroidia bacterium]|nr:hypothetical protein [Bacteroidia bacterium]
MASYPFASTDLLFNEDFTQIHVKDNSSGEVVSYYSIPNGDDCTGLEVKHTGSNIIITEGVSFGAPTHIPRVRTNRSTGECAKFDKMGGGGLIIGVGDVRFRAGSTGSPYFRNNYSSSSIILTKNDGVLSQYLDEDPEELDAAPSCP